MRGEYGMFLVWYGDVNWVVHWEVVGGGECNALEWWAGRPTSHQDQDPTVEGTVLRSGAGEWRTVGSLDHDTATSILVQKVTAQVRAKAREVLR